MDKNMNRVIIIGAGLAGLSAAVTLAEAGIGASLVSVQQSERAQSVLAAGGINGALNVMGEGDTPEAHFQDTMRAGVQIADPEAVRCLTEQAPDIIRWLQSIGVPFNQENGHIIQRNFGGQKKKRTAYVRSSSGKMIMTALIDEVRRYEAAGTVVRYPRHRFADIMTGEDGRCTGAVVEDTYTEEKLCLYGSVIVAAGGLNGFFPGMTTGTTANTGDAAAVLFRHGVKFSNLEMIQYHPTTISISGKRCLVSEAARGEGGRLFVERGKEKWYFMEEKYPELGNLMPRDVVSREMDRVIRDPVCGDQVYLDMTGLSKQIWENRLPDLRREILHYLGMDAAKTPVPVSAGIHYFMGGIDVDARHRTGLRGLYAAGECCSQYHGANRLGGNSMLGAIFGGITAAKTVMSEIPAGGACEASGQVYECGARDLCSPGFARKTGRILSEALGIQRCGNGMADALRALEALKPENGAEADHLCLARAMVMSALSREESRGAHYRTDCPEVREAWQGKTTARYADNEIVIGFEKCTGENCV